MGAIMRRYTTLFHVFIVVSAVSLASAHEKESCLTLPIQLLRDHLVVVHGSIDGSDERNLLIDTGALPSILDRGLARSLHLQEFAGGRLQVMGHTLETTRTLMPSIAVGPIHRQNVPVFVQDLSVLYPELHMHIDAIVGLDVLFPDNFSINYGGKSICFGTLPALPSSLPFAGGSQVVTIEIRIDHNPVRLLIDTGSSNPIVFAGRVHLGPQSFPSLGSSRDLGGAFAVQTVRLFDVEFDNVRFAALPAYLADDPGVTQAEYEGVIGVSSRYFRQVAFDFEHRIFSWEIESRNPAVSVQQAKSPRRKPPAASTLSARGD
jgi:hypothetical protein